MITFDAAAQMADNTQNDTNPTWSHTCSGTNRVLIVAVAYNVITDLTGPTDITYNGVSLTKLTNPATNFVVQYWYLVNPSSGTHDVAFSWASASGRQRGGSVSYKNVLQSGQPDAYISDTHNSSATANTALTTVAPKTMLIGAFMTNTTSDDSTSNGTIRVKSLSATYFYICDKLALSAGSNTLSMSNATDLNWTEIVASFTSSPSIGPFPTHFNS